MLKEQEFEEAGFDPLIEDCGGNETVLCLAKPIGGV